MRNLIDVVPGLKKKGNEYHGPCPYCGGGEDRFVVWPSQGINKTGRFWCRQCGHDGDFATYLSEIVGIDMKEALDVAGKPLENSGKIPVKWLKLDKEMEAEPIESLYSEDPNYFCEPTESVLSALTTALYRGDVELHHHLLEVIADRTKILLRVFRRFDEKFPGHLDAFTMSELQKEPEDIYELTGVRPGDRDRRVIHGGTWVGENSCEVGCKSDQCEHMAPFHYIPFNLAKQ